MGCSVPQGPPAVSLVPPHLGYSMRSSRGAIAGGGLLYLIVALTFTAVRAKAYLSSLVRMGHAVDLVSEGSLE